MNLLGWLKPIATFALKAFGLAQKAGLTDDLLEDTHALVAQAQAQFTDNDKRREWVIAALRASGVPEVVARLAVEMAVLVFKSKTKGAV